MPNYSWKGRTRGGRVQEGVLVADSRDAAMATLRRQQVRVTSLRQKGREIPFMPRLPSRIGIKSVAVFTRQFSVMLDAQENRKFRDIINQVRGDVEAGQSLADSMAKHPSAFDNLYSSMVAAGEAGGILDIILQRLSLYLEKLYKLRSQIRSAMIYPITVILIAFVVVWIILWKVIPVFAELFAGLGGELPWLTRMVVAASNAVGRFWWIVPPLVLGIWFGFRAYYRTHRGRRVIDGLALRLPVLGMLVRKIAVARFCRTLGTLTSSGVPIASKWPLLIAMTRSATWPTRFIADGGPDGQRR